MTRRWRSLAAGLAVLAVVATACDDDASDVTSSTAPASASSAPSEVTTVEGTAGSADTTAPGGDAVLTLGLLAPDAGLLNTLVVGQERGLRLALDDINAAGGVLGGPAASVRVAESASTPLFDTVTQLIDDGANVIVGPVGSATTATLLPLLDDLQLLACSASATATSLTVRPDVGSPPRFVRTALRDDHLAAIVAELVMAPTDEAAPPATVMVVGRDDVYGNELTAGLSAELAARGAATTTLAYPSRRVQFPDESAAVAAASPDRVVLVSFEEGPRLVADLAAAGYPVDHIVGLDGMLLPSIGEQAFPSDPGRADGLTVIGTTGDRALVNRLRKTTASQDQVAYGPQMYDCVITVALAAVAAGTTDTAAMAAQIGPVTSGGRTCSTYAHCVELLAAGEDIDYDGTTGHLGIDADGDVSAARVTTARVVDGQLQPIATQDVDLEAQRQDAVFASAVFVAQLQQGLKLLGFFEGDVTGIYDEATTAAVAALQRHLGLPDTGQYDAATDAALRARIGGRLDTIGTGLMELQQALADRGYYQGPIDGRWSDATIAAVKAFQTDLGVPPTGIIDVATLQAIYARGLASGQLLVPPPPETTLPPPATTAPPPPPTTAAPPPPTTSAPPPPTDAPTPSEPEPDEPDEPDLYEMLANDSQFTTFMELVAVAGFGTDLQQLGPMTVFAPTNAAFADLERDQLDRLMDEPGAAAALLRDLIVEDAINATQLMPRSLDTIGGGTLEVEGGGGATTVGGAAIALPDRIVTWNGIVHGMAAVPTPA